MGASSAWRPALRDDYALVRVSRGLGKAMAGLELASLDVTFADRGW